MSTLASPVGEWQDMDTTARWWRAVVVEGYGGRDTLAVVSHTGHTRIYADGGAFAGTNELDPANHAPRAETVWLVDSARSDGSTIDPWVWANVVRETGCAVVETGPWFGLCAGGDQPEEHAAWQLAYAHILLGYTPPSALFSSPSAHDWGVGLIALGRYPAQRVRRGLLSAITQDRAALAATGRAIRTTWKTDA